MTTELPLPLALPTLASLSLSTPTTTTTALPVDVIAAAETFSDADVAEVRHVVQRILVPCIFVIGLLGNTVSICVLTRKRMRCTTNIYLTALAITDIAYLTFVLLISLEHYEYMKYNCPLYWKLYGFMMWLADSCAYISIYIAVCFTIERFIAIRYPLKRQTFCTESLAKKVIAAVALFCLLTTLSTAFEHTYDINWKLIDDAYRPCNQTPANVSPTPASTTPRTTTVHSTPATVWQPDEHRANHIGYNTTISPATSPASRFFEHFDLGSGGGVGGGGGSGFGDSDHIPSRQRRLPATYTSAFVGVTVPATEPLTTATTASLLHSSRATRRSRRSTDNNSNKSSNERVANFNYEYNNEDYSNINNSVFDFNVTELCQNRTFYYHTLSNLGNNDLYNTIWSVFSLVVFVLFPLLVLATFNCFLIMLVHRSKTLRSDLTNASSIRRTKRKSNSGITGSVSQENRVTITLIAVVLLFIVCQVPWAIFLILNRYVVIELNKQRIAGNVCNMLVAINAAANFFLYCVLSDKYRKTVRELITGYRYRHRHARNNMSLYVPHTTTTLNGDGHSGAGGSVYSAASSRRYRGKASATGRLIA